MLRAIRFLGVLPLLFVSANTPTPLEIADADAIANWPAPPFWAQPAARAPGHARIEAVSTVSAPLPFIALPPCRIADTRGPAGPYGAPSLTGGAPRNFTLTGQCGIPASA